MTPQARSGAPFELLRFEAAPVPGALVVLQLEGRFRQSTRFGRPPLLVIEPGDDRPRIELTPIRTVADGHRWEGAYAVPAEALTGDARIALGVRGTLLELPAPDDADDGERLTALAREANRLRRGIEAAETDAAAARADAAEARAGLEGAVAAARAAALAESAERIDALEREVVEAHRLAAADADELRTEHAAALTEAARVAAADADALRAEHAAALTEAAARADAAEARASEVEAEHTTAADAALTAEMASLVDAQARAGDVERELRAAKEGIEVLRAELAEERERAGATIADLQHQLAAARDGDDDDLDETRPFTVAEERDADDDATAPFGPSERGRAPREPTLHDLLAPAGHEAEHDGTSVGRWIALAALVLFAFVLIGLLAGFLG
ncbi:MAG TPA: hypothetical protein VI318_18025 [Baekduia sp.]